MIELCCCGHANDHMGKPCAHPAIGGEGNCACTFGQRVDVAAFRLAVETNQMMADALQLLARLLAVAESAANLQSRAVNVKGGFKVEVRPRETPLIAVAR